MLRNAGDTGDAERYWEMLGDAGGCWRMLRAAEGYWGILGMMRDAGGC